jgi:hypothetical protein
LGLAQSLEAQKKSKPAGEAREQFAVAWQHADVDLEASRF